MIYRGEQRDIRYDETGLTVVHLSYTEPGLIAIYKNSGSRSALEWVTLDSIMYPTTAEQRVSYDFDEIGLYHYQVVDNLGRQ